MKITLLIPRLFLASVAIFVTLGSTISTAQADTIAVSYDFNEDPTSKLPVSAKTLFYELLWSSGDPLNTAEHELFHAIGFTINYSLFAAHVQPALTPPLINAGDRPFTENTDGSGDVLALLTPTTTHVDPDAGEINGRDQADSIMRPDLVNGQRLSDWEAAILNTAFDWESRNIKINVVYATPFTDAQKASITGAVTAVQTLFGSDGTGSVFTWTVSVVPEPSSFALLGVGTILLVGMNRRAILKKHDGSR